MEQQYTHTVHCFDDKSLRKHFVGEKAAVDMPINCSGKATRRAFFPIDLRGDI